MGYSLASQPLSYLEVLSTIVASKLELSKDHGSKGSFIDYGSNINNYHGIDFVL